MHVDKASLGDRVLAELRRMIIAGDLPAGSSLRQEKLAAELGVSRIPVREAIRKLEAEGLVQSEPHKGSVVSPLSGDEVMELFEIRMRLEPWLFGLAIPAISEAQVTAAEAIIEAASEGHAIESWSELNWQFHAALYEPALRAHSMRLLKGVHQNANRYVNLHLAVVHDRALELEDHRDLVACARERDVAGGIRTLSRHIERVAEGLRVAIGRRAEAPALG